MKRLSMIALVSTVILSASAASATCFNFVNGKGPAAIGNVQLAAPATSVCMGSKNKMDGTVATNLTFADSQGKLAIVGTQELSRGRCFGVCQLLALGYGNANGQNVNFAGATVKIETQQDPRLGIVQGVLEIQAGRGFAQKFLVMEAR